MRPFTHRLVLVSACALVGVTAGLRPADAGDVATFEPNAHSLTGTLDAGEEHYVPLQLPEGTALTIQFRRDKKNGALSPAAELVGPDGATVPIPSNLIKTKKGYDVKKLPIEVTGAYVLVLRGLEDSSGGYSLKVKAKYPKKISGVLDANNGEDLEIPFPATTGAKVAAKVSGSKRGAVPDNPRVRQPNGNAFGPSKLKRKKTGFAFSRFEQSSGFGTYALTFELVPATAGEERTFKYALKVAFPKAKKAKLSYGDLIIPPLVTGVTPNDVPISADAVSFSVDGRFFQPGATFALKLAGQADWRPEGQTVTDTSLSVLTTTLGRAPGRWDLVVNNPSGGEAEIPGAVLVRPATPEVLSAEPGFVVDDTTEATVTLRGSNLSTTTEFEFTRDLGGGVIERFVPTRIQNAPVGSGVAVTVSTLRRPLGTYDVTATNPGPAVGVPGSQSRTTADIFEIRNAPPRLDAATPDRNLAGGTFTLTATGAELEPGASLTLLREGEADVAGTSVQVAGDGASATARFDMDAAAVGKWDLRLQNADGQEDTLDEVFAVVADSSHTFGEDMIGEPTMALAAEHDLGLVAWVETDENGSGGSRWRVMARMFDAFLNTWSGDAFEVSSGTGDSKRTVSAAYNPTVDQWLVVWTQHTFASTLNERIRAGLNPTSGTVYQVWGRRVSTSGATFGNVIDFIDGSPSATGSGQIYQDFEYHNPQVVFGPWDGNWYMTFSQQWDALTVDDFDAFTWRLAASDPKLDSNFHVVLHATQNHEGDCLAAVDDDRNRLFIVGSCDSRQLTTTSPREIEAKYVTSDGGLSPGAGGSNVGEVIAVTARSGEVEDFNNPRPVYNSETGEYLVVYERINEAGSGKQEIRAQRMSAAGDSRIGNEIVVAADSGNDLILPRVLFNPVADEYLITWTVDSPAAAYARAQRLSFAGAKVGDAIDLGGVGSGLPIIDVDPTRGTYTKFVPTGFTQLGADRKATGGAALEIFE